jgi:hypothetical protein
VLVFSEYLGESPDDAVKAAKLATLKEVTEIYYTARPEFDW